MLLSVCLLTFNSSKTLEKAIHSILMQDFNDFELIISDDCSTDNTWDIINNYAALNQCIIPIKTPKNLGTAGNANFAVEKSKGKYIAILHHDDEFRTDLFRKWIRLMENNSNVGLCFNDYSCKQMNILSIHSEQLKRHYKNIIRGKYFLKNDLLKYWGCPVWGTYITRKEIWNNLRGFDKKFDLLADVDLTMRIAAKWDIGYLNESLIDLKRIKQDEYPIEYTEFTWHRMFLLFDIHSNNINKQNFPNYFQYMYKRFAFRNKVSIEIIKWHIYSLIKKKNFIIKDFQYNNNNYELYYSRIVRKFLNYVGHIS